MRREELVRKALTVLLRTGEDFISDALIAKALGVSRPTVRGVINELRRYGYPVESNPLKGYRLIPEDDLSLADHYVKALLTGTSINYSIHYVGGCSSTQDIADALAREGGPEGLVVIAEEMSEGRGRLGRKWVAGRGGVWLTMLLRPLMLKGLQLISLGAGVAVAEALRELYGVNVGLKWPNDVLAEGKKLCGILVEGRVEADRIHYLLVGVGINVNNEIPKHLKAKAVSLKELLGTAVPRVPLLTLLLGKFATIYEALKRGDHEYVLSRWRKLSLTLGKEVKVITPSEVIEGTAINVGEDGSLILKADGSLRRVYAGDVVHLRQKP